MSFSVGNVVSVAGGGKVFPGGVDIQDPLCDFPVVVDRSGIILIEDARASGIPSASLRPVFRGIGIETETVINAAECSRGAARVFSVSEEEIPGIEMSDGVGLGGIEVVADIGNNP